MTTKPNHWTVGTTTEGRVHRRPGPPVLRRPQEVRTTSPRRWEVELIDGKRIKAKSSADAGEKGRAYRDAQQAKGNTRRRADPQIRIAKTAGFGEEGSGRKATAKKA